MIRLFLGLLCLFSTLHTIDADSIQDRLLFNVAQQYLADSQEEAINISLEIEPNGGKPGDICGPLAITMLQEAGFVSQLVDPHDFWFFNPHPENPYRDGYLKTIEIAFPEEEFTHFSTDISIREFDFDKFPLKIGDFLYLYAGCCGTFEHMIVVTRVDELGNPFTVTNHLTEDGYRISELLIYDKMNENVGYFYDLTNLSNTMTIGTTGYGGFELWRSKRINTCSQTFGNTH